MRFVSRRAVLSRVTPLPLILALPLFCLGATAAAVPDGADPERPNLLIVTIDTLRADRLSALGYERDTSPNLDRLIRGGVNFLQARTVEPLTNPALGSMLTSLPPHVHGATRNGLRLRQGLVSLPKVLRVSGYRTAAFIGNWTLRDKLSGLAEHFDHYEEVLTRRRWFGLIRNEATAEDLTRSSLDWIEEHLEGSGGQPFLAWVHYVEPHAPYRLQKEFVSILDRGKGGEFSKKERYDTEIAFVDASVGELLEGLKELLPEENTLIVFTSDHGESLGEHGYWGHGRHLYEPTLHIPMALYWKGRLPAITISAPALISDLAPTILRLLGLPVPRGFEGYDWTSVLRGDPPPDDRITRYEAHRGAVISAHKSDRARQSGLLAIARVQHNRKEIYRVQSGKRWLFDLDTDSEELNPLVPRRSEPSEDLRGWLQIVYKGLNSHDLPEPLDEESIAKLRALGYVE